MRNTKILTFATAISLLSIVTSCREELLSTNETSESKTLIQDATVKNGRLYFPNKESLQYQYDKVKNSEDEVIAKYMDKKNIISLRPILTKDNAGKISQQLMKRVEILKSNKRFMHSKGASSKITNSEEIADDIDDLEEIVGDDAYAAFLDSRAEIQVADEIYKYTDAGLFIVKEENYDKLGDYLAVKNISDDLLYPTEENVREDYVSSVPSEQRVSVTEDIDYFNAKSTNKIAPMDPDSGGGGGGPTTGSGGSTTDSNQQMVNFINGLQNCDTYHTWLQSLFGDSDMCVDKYESRYRVKTKAFNYNYYLVYNLGVKVKHQYKGWTGFWRKEDAQEMRIGVLLGTFYYDYNDIMNPSPPQTRVTSIYNNNNRAIFNSNTFWTQSSYYPGIYNMTGYSIQNYPKIFQDDYYVEDILPFLNVSSNNTLIDQGLYSALTSANKNLSASNMNKLFWNEVVKRTGKFAESLGKTKPDNNITYSYNVPQYGKIIIGKTYYNQKTNVDNLEKTFDWGFQIGFTMDSNGHVNPSTSASSLKKPQDFRVLMYGIAKRNGQWHGSKINTGI